MSGGLSEQAMADLARNDYVAMPSFRLRELEERAVRAERALADCKRSNEGLLDAVERLNATIERKDKELADLHLIVMVDPDELAEADRALAEAKAVLKEIAEGSATRNWAPIAEQCLARLGSEAGE